MKTYECLCCNAEVTKKNTAGKYCSNVCQKTYETNEKLRLWLEEDVKLGKQIVRKYLKELHGDKCSVCSLDGWLGKAIDLEIDHTDGNPYNNRPENLRLICPNCHSQTPTFKNKNRGNGRVLNPSKGWLLV